jgi:uncharacterized metal-binding protein
VAIVRALPVLYACAGCSEFGYSAARVAQQLDDRGDAEMAWLGEARPKLAWRYPTYALEACDRRCAEAWLSERGIRVQRTFVLSPLERLDVESAVARIAPAL